MAQPLRGAGTHPAARPGGLQALREERADQVAGALRKRGTRPLGSDFSAAQRGAALLPGPWDRRSGLRDRRCLLPGTSDPLASNISQWGLSQNEPPPRSQCLWTHGTRDSERTVTLRKFPTDQSWTQVPARTGAGRGRGGLEGGGHKALPWVLPRTGRRPKLYPVRVKGHPSHNLCFCPFYEGLAGHAGPLDPASVSPPQTSNSKKYQEPNTVA